jgi:hypothetical protein
VFLKFSRAGMSAMMRPTRNRSRGARIGLGWTVNLTNPMIPRRLIKRSTLLRWREGKKVMAGLKRGACP